MSLSSPFFRCRAYGALAAVILTAALARGAGAAPHFELEAAPAFTSFQYEDAPGEWENGWRTTLGAGANLEFPIRESAAIQTGLRYAQFGNRVHVHVEVDTGSSLFIFDEHFRLTQSVVAVPVRFVLRPTAGRSLFFAAGPEAAFTVAGRSEVEPSEIFGSSLNEGSYANIRKTLAPVVLLGDVEAGTGFRIGRQDVRAGLRYTHGITDAGKKDDWLINWKTQSFEAVFGLVW